MSEAPRIQDLRSHLNDSPYHLCILPSPLYDVRGRQLAKHYFRPGKTITVLWLGSSLANESQDVVRNVANNFIAALEANSSLAEIQFLVGLDGTRNVNRGYYIGDFVIILSISRNLLPPQLF
ncbi:uncharacterized protein RAG0_10152 [Rhynchosporium agropyri]|uniref:Uncharacterized protein n=1 Tax=Rhynchosporium agropyri TaxID=914238 RepID=A0A1E1L1D9_9HELO|nr:uncharacterized protein RAG0_10152 [Rhynchosporium agropyri]